jgi:DNA-binding response OmpR family regulator
MSKVLVVDDLPTELELICRTLQNAGIEVLRANDGDEAINRLREESADLVILDVVMPRMNGFEVIRELRDNEKTKKTPIILCTQKNTDIDKSWGMELGADAYITKPFDPQQLVSTVKRLL